MERQSSTKRFAVCIYITTVILSAYCAYKGLEGATSAIFSGGTLSATGLWANRKWNNTKLAEIDANKK
jgi:hypothetical protein